MRSPSRTSIFKHHFVEKCTFALKGEMQPPGLTEAPRNQGQRVCLGIGRVRLCIQPMSLERSHAVTTMDAHSFLFEKYSWVGGGCSEGCVTARMHETENKWLQI